MDASLSTQLALAALVCSVAALFFSLVAAFPGLKLVLAAIRDAVLWLALVLVLGGVGYVLWQERNLPPPAAFPPARDADRGEPRGEVASSVWRENRPETPLQKFGVPSPIEPVLRPSGPP